MANRRASGEGLLRWRKDRKHWEGRITIESSDDGKPISKCFSGKTQREVIEKMTRFREQLHGMTLSADSRMKLKDWSERWLNEYMVHVIRPKTISRYRKDQKLTSGLTIEVEIFTKGTSYWESLIARGLERQVLNYVDAQMLDNAVNYCKGRYAQLSKHQVKEITRIVEDLKSNGIV